MIAFPAYALIAISQIPKSNGTPFFSAALMVKKSLISSSLSPKKKGILLMMILFKSLPVTIQALFSNLALSTASLFGAILDAMLFRFEGSDLAAH